MILHSSLLWKVIYLTAVTRAIMHATHLATGRYIA